MPRVTMLVTSNLDKDPRVSREADIAFRNGYEVTVICRFHTGIPMPYTVIPLNITSPSGRLFKYLERLFVILSMIWRGSRSRPDIIHCNDLDTLPAGYAISLITGAKLFYDVHEYYVGNTVNVGQTGKKIAIQVEKFICQRAARISTVCNPIADMLAEKYGIPRPQLILNPPYYTDTSHLPARPWREQFGDKIVVLFQGQYSYSYTGLLDAIRAGALLPENVVIALRGYGPLEADMKALIQEKNVADKVFMIAPVPMQEMVESAVGADIGIICLSPDLYNSQVAVPNKLFEYMMAGLPVVVPELPGVQSIVIEGEMGVFYRPDSYESMADAIKRLANDPAHLLHMKQYCLEAARRFCWDSEGLKLIQAYGEILQKKR